MRYPRLLSSLVYFAMISSVPGQRMLIDEPFNSLDDWKDLSTAITWEGQPENGSAWELTDGVLSLTEEAMAQFRYEEEYQLRTFTAIDKQFEEPITHREGDLVIELRIRWVEGADYAYWKMNRVIVTLVHDYPEGGPDLTLDDKVTDFSKAWWARPSYQLRMYGATGMRAPGRSNDALLMYGGGLDRDGEFEIRHYEPPEDPLGGPTGPRGRQRRWFRRSARRNGKRRPSNRGSTVVAAGLLFSGWRRQSRRSADKYSNRGVLVAIPWVGANEPDFLFGMEARPIRRRSRPSSRLSRCG